MESYYLLSIDPGASGFLSVIKVAEEITPIESLPIPTMKVLINKKNRTKIDEVTLSNIIHSLVDKYKIKQIIIEKQQVMSGKPTKEGESGIQGTVSSASIMEHFGFLKGVCLGKQIEPTVIPAKTWQTIYPDSLKKNKSLTTKDRSKLYCAELFPTVDLRRNSRCKTISDGKTDSILIGYYQAIKTK